MTGLLYSLDWARQQRLVAALLVRAPAAGRPVVSVVAALLAGSACSDALLIAADALEEQSRHLAVIATGVEFDRERESLRVLVELLRGAAPARAERALFEEAGRG